MIFDSGRFKGVVYGGPYIQRPLGIVGVKMAEEIKKPCDVDIPTRDFDVPNVDKFKTGLVLGILYLKTRGELYVGCMGGIGRTGLYMAGLAKVMEELHTIDATKVLVKDAPLCVGYVREQYLSHAVETKQQIAWIEALDVRDIVAAVKNF